MKDDEDEQDYEKYYGSGSIFSQRFVLGLFTEFIGTFIINFIGLLACLLHSTDPYDVNALFIGIAFGLSYLLVSKVCHKVGTCHFNPAISLCALFLGNVSILYCFTSFLVQMAAVTLAAFLLDQSLGEEFDLRYTTVFKAKDMAVMALFLSEFVGSLLILCCRAVPCNSEALRHIYMTVAIIVSVTVFIPYSGGSMNPARAIGPSFLLNEIPDYYWVYWAGPLGASLLSMFLLYAGILHNSNQF